MGERLVVIGGDAAGMTAATNARRGRSELEIVVLERGVYTSYSACGIPYLVAGDVAEVDHLVARTPQEFRDRHRLDVRLEHEATNIDLDGRRVEVRDHGHDRTFSIGFDHLMIATGAEPRRLDVPGVDADWIRGVQTLGDGADLLALAEAGGCREVVVVGGGYIGLEMAEAFHRRGSKVTLVEASEHLMGTLDPDMAGPIADALEGLGVDVRLGVRVEGFEDHSVQTDSGSIRADIAILGTGVLPGSKLAEEAGVPLGVRGAIAVDRQQRTGVDGVWSAGDCADTHHLVSGKRVHVALGTVANKTGRVAGVNLGGGYRAFPGVVGTAITKVCQTEIARTGLNEREATDAGFAFTTSRVETTVAAGYFADPGTVAVKMLAERGTRRLLGGQLVGSEGSAKRIDTMAAALTAGFTVDELLDLDLSYAPPFSSVWDAWQIAARGL
jgi:NADPH-dependent 2,4-dienoyl-CoA reductase/sulfur reductase-like enzyme